MSATYGFKIYSQPSLAELAKAAEFANAKLPSSFRDSLRTLGRHFVDLAGQEARGGSEGSIAKGIFFRTYDQSGTFAELRVYPGTIGAYHLYGTGIYGPVGRMITPVNASVMRWESKNGDIVFARATRGVRPDPFFSRAYRRWLPRARSELRAVSQNWYRELANNTRGLNL